MKRLFLFLSLFIVGNIKAENSLVKSRIAEWESIKQDVTDRVVDVKAPTESIPQLNSKPPLPLKPTGLSEKVLRQKQIAAAALTKKNIAPIKIIKKTPPPVMPKSIKSRNLAIFLNEESVVPARKRDVIVSEALASLMNPSSYTIFTSPTLMSSLFNKYRLYQDTINPDVTIERLNEKYPSTEEYAIDFSLLRNFVQEKKDSHLSSSPFSPIGKPSIDWLRVIDYCQTHNIFDEWVVYETKHNFYVLVPKKQKLPGFSLKNLQNLGTLNSFINKRIVFKLASHENFETWFLEDLKNLTKGNKNIERFLNIFITGHGYDRPNREFICDLSQKYFKKLIEFLTTLNTHSFFYSTCFGGGKNSVTTFDKELPYIVIAHGITDTTIPENQLSYRDLKTYFKNISDSKLHAALTSLEKEYDFDSLQQKLIVDYKIRLPKTHWFTLAQINTDLQMIGKVKATTASLNQQPIILSNKPCALLTPTVGTVALPDITPLPLFMGLYPSTNNKLYVFKEMMIDQQDTSLEETIKTLHSMFEQSQKQEYRLYENSFYIESLFVGIRMFKNVILHKNLLFIQYDSETVKTVQVKRSDIPIGYFAMQFLTKEQLDVTDFNEIVAQGKKQLEKYWKNINKNRSLNTLQPSARTFDFAQLRQDLVEMKPEEFTDDVINDFKKEFNNSDLSDIEKTVLNSVLEAQKAL